MALWYNIKVYLEMEDIMEIGFYRADGKRFILHVYKLPDPQWPNESLVSRVIRLEADAAKRGNDRKDEASKK